MNRTKKKVHKQWAKKLSDTKPKRSDIPLVNLRRPENYDLISYRPYSVTPSGYTRALPLPHRWTEDEIKAEQDRFGVSGNNVVTEVLRITSPLDLSGWYEISSVNDSRSQVILEQYRNALKIQARRKKVIAEYALRYTEFCKLNAESRRKQKRVSEQFKELVKWKLNRVT